jgi:SagB-type dehydrogenase family enzyme
MTDGGIALFKPDLGCLTDDDPPFTLVLEQRVSRREQGTQPITARQVGEFLYRVARVREVIAPHPAVATPHEVTSRPYPSGGGAYDLELYLTVGRCADLLPGIYHYDPLGHRLHELTDHDANVEALLRAARIAAAMPVDPQILITLTSRFRRLSWKYSGLAYALALKNVGVLFQTMYLVATAMGLAPCALGGGDAELFASATGVDRFAEPSVGEFILGSMPGDGLTVGR